MKKQLGETLFFLELWKIVKYEPAYLYAYDLVNKARLSNKQYLSYYNLSHIKTW